MGKVNFHIRAVLGHRRDILLNILMFVNIVAQGYTSEDNKIVIEGPVV